MYSHLESRSPINGRPKLQCDVKLMKILRRLSSSSKVKHSERQEVTTGGSLLAVP